MLTGPLLNSKAKASCYIVVKCIVWEIWLERNKTFENVERQVLTFWDHIFLSPLLGLCEISILYQFFLIVYNWSNYLELLVPQAHLIYERNSFL